MDYFKKEKGKAWVVYFHKSALVSFYEINEQEAH
jgi:hypothetical protein